MRLETRKTDHLSQLFIVDDKGDGFIVPMTDQANPVVPEIEHLNAASHGFDPARDPISDIVEVDEADPTHYRIIRGIGRVSFQTKSHPKLIRQIAHFWEAARENS